MDIIKFQKKIKDLSEKERLNEFDLQLDTAKYKRPFLKFVDYKGAIKFGIMESYSTESKKMCVIYEQRYDGTLREYVDTSNILCLFLDDKELLEDINMLRYKTKTQINSIAIDLERKADIFFQISKKCKELLIEEFGDEKTSNDEKG